MAHLHAARGRRDREGAPSGEGGRERGDRAQHAERAERGERAGYLEDVRSAKSQMLRPKEAGSLSWRCDDPCASVEIFIDKLLKERVNKLLRYASQHFLVCAHQMPQPSCCGVPLASCSRGWL